MLIGRLNENARTTRDALHYGFIGLPLKYAKQALDKNHNSSISLQEASQDQIFQSMVSVVGGNISSLFLTQSNSNNTKLLKSKYSPNNYINININTELKPILEKRSEDLLKASKCENPSTCPT